MDIQQFNDMRELKKNLDEIEKNSKILKRQLKDCLFLQNRINKITTEILKKDGLFDKMNKGEKMIYYDINEAISSSISEKEKTKVIGTKIEDDIQYLEFHLNAGQLYDYEIRNNILDFCAYFNSNSPGFNVIVQYDKNIPICGGRDSFLDKTKIFNIV